MSNKDTGGLPIAPSMDVALAGVDVPREEPIVGARTVRIVGMAVLVGIGAAFIAEVLMGLIGLITNAVYYHRWSSDFVSPAGADPGLVTAIAVRDAVAAGSEVTYLKVDVANHAAQRLYRRLGFAAVAGQVPDLLLRR